MRKIAQLQCLETHPRIAAKEGQQTLTFIMFHGYGADAYDLRGLSEAIAPNLPIHFLFPQGILEVPIGPGWTGRAWWNINVAAMEAAALSGAPRDLAQEKFPTLPEVRNKIMAAVESLKVPWSTVILGGFSQGAMLATDIFLHAPEAPKALIAFSGALINKSEWQSLLPKRAGSPFLLTHGKSDMILAHKGSAQLETFLINGGLKGKLVSFEGTHEIPMLAVQKANEFLQNLA